MAVSGNIRTSRAIALLVTSAWFLGLTSSSPNRDQHRDSEVLRPKDSRGMFSPRMDYDEWTPLGRGDPLKNDPTYDYVPPVLDRVHYWIDPASRTPDPPISSSLPLGQTSIDPSLQSDVSVLQPNNTPPDTDVILEEDSQETKVSADSRHDTYDPFMKFVNGPKFSSPQQQYYHHHHTMILPHQSSKPYAPIPASYYPSSYYQHHVETQPSYLSEVLTYKPSIPTSLPPDAQQRPPYTMLVPPPLQAEDSFSMELQEPNLTTEPPTTTPYYSTTPPAIIVEEANLIFQSSTLPDWEEGKTQLATLAEPSNYVTHRVPTLPPKIETIYTTGFPTNSTISSTETIKTLSTIKPINRPNYSANIQIKDNSHFPTLQALLQSEIKQEHNLATTVKTTTTRPNTVTMTTVTSLTTDPLFSHYKQPAEPLRGPMYLIIQGHSKVKTYGINKRQNSFHGIPIQNSNEIQHKSNYELHSRRVGREMDYLDDVEDEKWLYERDENRSTNARDYPELMTNSDGESVHGLNFITKSLENDGHKDEEKLLDNEIRRIPAGEGVQGQEDNLPMVSEATKSEQILNRTKRQLSLEDFIPLDDDTAEELAHDFLVEQGQGSGIGAFIASALTRLGRVHDGLDQAQVSNEINSVNGSRNHGAV